MSMSAKFKPGDKVAVVESDISKVRGETGKVIGLVAPSYFSGDGVIVKWDGPTAKGYERTLYRASNLTLADPTQASSSAATPQPTPK